MDTKLLQEIIKEWLMSAEIDPSVYDQYIKKNTFKQVNDKKIALIVPSDFAKSILKQIEKEINNKLKSTIYSDITFVFLTEKDLKSEKDKATILVKNSNTPTFDNFIPGPSNVAAYNAAKSAVNEFGKWNPIFMYGNSGLGKTHLLKSVENYVKRNTDLKVSFVTSSDFRNEIVKGIVNKESFNTIEKIKAKFFESDYFLLDDIQFLAANDKTNEILFNIFNELIRNNKQIIITSDKFPEKLSGFDKRLISRFLSGLNVELKLLDEETSINILKYKLKLSGFEMTEEAQKYIANYYSDDVRKINSIFNQIDFNIIQNVIQTPVDLKQLEKILSGYSLVSGDKITVSLIKNAIAKEYNITISQLESKSRAQPYAFARQMAMKLCHELLKLGYTQIGYEFGGRDHSTVYNALERVEMKLKEDKDINKLYKNIKKTLSK